MSSYKDNVISIWDTYRAEEKVRTEERLALEEVEEKKVVEEQETIIQKTIVAPTPIPTPLPSVIIPLPVQPTVPQAIIPGSASTIDKSAFQALDQYAVGTPELVAISVDSLAAYLVQPAKNGFEKTRVIYRWITHNISYDFSAYLTGNYRSTNADNVLISRSSICAGYSGLFYALAKSAGLEVVTINGWAKGYDYSAGDQISGPSNHAWNAVRINGGWYLIDSTWGAGSIVQEKFVREFDEAYFLTHPEQFIYNHFPENSKWQLLDPILSKTDFSALPYVHSKFFSFGLELGDNIQSIIYTGNSLSMTFPVPNNTYLLVGLIQGNNELADSLTSVKRVGSQYQINASFPNPGTYILRIYARKNDEYGGIYDGILEYKILAE
ncbi:transglutaminase domain-containing protein [Chloroflexota bacterium]